MVLIGSETADREWVEYEIKESYKKGSGLLGIYIHNVKDLNGKTSEKGKNPITKCRIRNIETYDWVRDNGYNNLSQWVENAYNQSKQRLEEQKARRDDAKPINLGNALGFAAVMLLVIGGLAALFGGSDKNQGDS